jgi:hypothetical protein
MPIRIQLSRRKGWRMPPNTVKVDRTTKWGNPCVVGKHGTQAECVEWHRLALHGLVVLGMKNADGTWLSDSLVEYRAMAKRNFRYLRGKNLACWCKPGAPCHADVLLEFANR